MDNFWKNVALEIDSRGMSEKEFAKRAGVPRSVVSKGAASGRSPNVAAALRVSKALGLSIETLMEGAGGGKMESVQEKKLALYEKYAETIDALEHLPDEIGVLVERTVTAARAAYSPKAQ